MLWVSDEEVFYIWGCATEADAFTHWPRACLAVGVPRPVAWQRSLGELEVF